MKWLLLLSFGVLLLKNFGVMAEAPSDCGQFAHVHHHAHEDHDADAGSLLPDEDGCHGAQLLLSVTLPKAPVVTEVSFAVSTVEFLAGKDFLYASPELEGFRRPPKRA